MPFSDFTNPFKNPNDIPARYREHASTQKLFRPDGSYLRPLEDPVTLWAIDHLVSEYGVPLEAMASQNATVKA